MMLTAGQPFTREYLTSLKRADIQKLCKARHLPFRLLLSVVNVFIGLWRPRQYEDGGPRRTTPGLHTVRL